MDVATIIGILSGLTLIGLSIFNNGNWEIFLHVPSMMIVVGGALAATLVNFPIGEVIGVMGVVRKAFQGSRDKSAEIITNLVALSKLSRREGILAIDSLLPEIDNDFLRTGLELAVDGAEPETIRNIMETELSYIANRHNRGQMIFMSLGTYAPAFGMIGTLIGLISMLRTLDDPSNIGSGMATALITTFYGAALANLLFLPIAGKLKNRSDEEILWKEMIVEGVLAIQYGEHPRNIERKLKNYVPPKVRKDVNTDNDQAKRR
ncbi:MAG: motility protein A [Candidatus Neomarinimicrobiota bacterium]